jgi:hypothetical protein
MDDKDKRRKRNARYYQMKRKRAGGPDNLVQLFPTQKPTIELKRQSPFLLACVMGLAIALTGYLMTETTKFFTQTEGGGFMAVWKAFLCEGVIVAFSVIRFQDTFSQIMRHVVLLGMCAYSLWAVSSGVILSANQDYQESSATRQMVTDLEKQVADKESMISTYIARDWIGVARSQQKDSDALRRRLTELRRLKAETRPPQLILNTVLNLVLMRLILMIANILVVRRLKEMLSCSSLHFKTHSQSFKFQEL